MWGLDQIDPVTAITAMNGMNASVRNGVFFPVFFLTPVFGFIMAAVLFAAAQKRAALFFGLAGLTYLCGGRGRADVGGLFVGMADLEHHPHRVLRDRIGACDVRIA